MGHGDGHGQGDVRGGYDRFAQAKAWEIKNSRLIPKSYQCAQILFLHCVVPRNRLSLNESAIRS